MGIKNNLWRLFRIGVEDEIVPKEVTENNLEFVEQLIKHTSEEENINETRK